MNRCCISTERMILWPFLYSKFFDRWMNWNESSLKNDSLKVLQLQKKGEASWSSYIYTMEQKAYARERFLADPDVRVSRIARETGVSRITCYRIREELRKKGT